MAIWGHMGNVMDCFCLSRRVNGDIQCGVFFCGVCVRGCERQQYGTGSVAIAKGNQRPGLRPCAAAKTARGGTVPPPPHSIVGVIRVDQYPPHIFKSKPGCNTFQDCEKCNEEDIHIFHSLKKCFARYARIPKTALIPNRLRFLTPSTKFGRDKLNLIGVYHPHICHIYVIYVTFMSH